VRDIVRVVLAGKRIIVRNALLAALLAAGLVFLIPVTYTAEAVIFTPQQSQSSLSAMAQLSGIGGGAGAGLSALGLLGDFGLRTPTSLYIGILESRTVADGIIRRLDLRRIYAKKDLYSTRKRLIRNTSVKSGKDTLIHILVEDRSPKLAAAIAQAYLDELFRVNSSVALNEASQRRQFFEQQIAKEKTFLSTAENSMKDTQLDTGLFAPTGQADALVRAVSVLHAQILTKRAQVEAMRTYLADDNPRMRAANRELGAMQADLTKLERGQRSPGSPEVPAGQLPEAGLAFLRSYRDVRYHETLFEVLSKQYEAARLDEARAGSAIQVIDKPVPPERKSWPPRTIIVVTCFAFAGMGTSLWLLWKHPPVLS